MERKFLNKASSIPICSTCSVPLNPEERAMHRVFTILGHLQFFLYSVAYDNTRSVKDPRAFHGSRTKTFLTVVEIVDYGLIDGEGNRVVGIDDDFSRAEEVQELVKHQD